jgi:hypothetical protein
MKHAILLLLLVSSVFVHGQSLKEALYGGKLKNEPGTVIRKGDDLASKMDTARKAPAEEPAKTTSAAPANTASGNRLTPTDSATGAVAGTETITSEPADDPATAPAVAPETAAAPKDNNAMWKAYMTTIANTLNAEVLTSKKVKRGTYYVTVSYTIETDGQTSVTDVFVAPENGFLQQQIKDRLATDLPQLNPVLSSSGAPRKVNRKYNFTLTKE